MLIQFSVENYRSIRDRLTLDMSPAKSQNKKEHIICDDKGKKTEVLPIGIMYGANASGKSNILRAVSFAQRCIFFSADSDFSFPMEPYRLDPEYENRPSIFEFVFKTEGIVYKYGFAITQKAVIEEWLYGYNPRPYVIFERHKKETLKIGTKVQKKDVLRKSFKFIFEKMLLLTLAYTNEDKVINPVAKWFNDHLRVLTPDHIRSNLVEMARDNKDFLRFLSDWMKQADVGISNVGLHEQMMTLKDKHKPSSFNILAEPFVKSLFQTYSAQEDGSILFSKLVTKHAGVGDKELVFSPLDESEGTQKMMHYTAMLYDLKQEPEMTYLVDEFETSLHPVICEKILEAFLRLISKNNTRGQLILTTHNTNLLDIKNLRRDEIWFVEKDKSGSSHVTSLAEYRQKNPNLAIEKRYLQGRYGAIPMLGKIEI